jgi:hypothetical protein
VQLSYPNVYLVYVATRRGQRYSTCASQNSSCVWSVMVCRVGGTTAWGGDARIRFIATPLKTLSCGSDSVQQQHATFCTCLVSELHLIKAADKVAPCVRVIDTVLHCAAQVPLRLCLMCT